ncbi:hypothetical protein CBW58_21410 [Yersinia frederiksenii]|nr:hypothetical protein CBW58_21410 [Yersinia frederiksenii]
MNRLLSQYLLGVSKANVLIKNSARMLRREEKDCQPVKSCYSTAQMRKHDIWMMRVKKTEANFGLGFAYPAYSFNQ